MIERFDGEVRRDLRRILSLDVTWSRSELMRMSGPFVRIAKASLPDVCGQINHTLMGVEFAYLAAGCDRIAHRQRYGEKPVNGFLPADLYLMLFVFVAERFVAFLEEQDALGTIHVEGRGSKENARVIQMFATMLNEGTDYYEASRFRDRLATLTWFTKDDRKAGLRIADWYNWTLSRKLRRDETVEGEFDKLKGRIWRGETPHLPGQVGLKTWPKPLGRLWLGLPLAAEQ